MSTMEHGRVRVFSGARRKQRDDIVWAAAPVVPVCKLAHTIRAMQVAQHRVNLERQRLSPPRHVVADASRTVTELDSGKQHALAARSFSPPRASLRAATCLHATSSKSSRSRLATRLLPSTSVYVTCTTSFACRETSSDAREPSVPISGVEMTTCHPQPL